ncbi:hypothetical protein JXL19_06605 [bacterium]|nr:hypothetical protein [bacterium]
MRSKIIVLSACIFFFLPFMFGRSVDARIYVGGSLTHEKEASPGETYEGEIVILNNSEEIGEVKLYQTDYLFFADGRNSYAEPASTLRSNAKWITFNPKRLMVAPHQKETVHYSVKVPDKEGQTGTYWSMIMVEPISEGSPESSMEKKGDITIGVRQIFRYGIQLVTHIDNTGSRKIRFLNTKIHTEEDGIKTLRVDVENVGDRSLRPALSVELYDEKGIQIGRYEAGSLNTYPGTSVRFKINLETIRDGILKALVIADCGGDDIFGATYTMKILK